MADHAKQTGVALEEAGSGGRWSLRQQLNLDAGVAFAVCPQVLALVLDRHDHLDHELQLPPLANEFSREARRDRTTITRVQTFRSPRE